MTEAISPQPESQPRSRAPLFLLAFFLLIAIGAGLAWRAKLQRDHEWSWGQIAMSEPLARVPEAWSAQTLAERLEKSKKIRDPKAFLEAATKVNLQKVAPGGYQLPEKAGPQELAQIFQKGPTHQEVTFPEGFTALQIAQRLQARGFAGGEELKKLAYPAKGFSPLEGRLFPDTYWLPLQADAKQLAERLKNRYREILQKLPAQTPKIKGKPLTQDQVLVLASLVERETPYDNERAHIAGVLLHRLNIGMRLQCDATVQYAHVLAVMNEAGHKERLLFTDLKIVSPFNTYLNAGLPPAPICNPGEKSLLAAMKPMPTDDLFYSASPVLKGHRFAKTFEEHKRNTRLARKEKKAMDE